MHSELKALLAGFLSILTTGCFQRAPIATENLIVLPGVGISNILELRMTPVEIKRAAIDFTQKELKYAGAWNLSVPSLGAMWEQEQIDQPLPAVHFLVTSNLVSRFPADRALAPFRGGIAGGLSFSKDGAVTRNQVIQVFGEPNHAIVDALTLPEPVNKMREWALKGEAYSWKHPSYRGETLTYPQRGIAFELDAGKVVSFNIFYPTKVPPKSGQQPE